MNDDGGSSGQTPSSYFHHFADFVVRSARVVLAVWLVAIAALAAQGLDLGDRLSAEQPVGADGPAARGQALAERAFGAEDALVLMLRGPQRQLDRDGPRVQRALAALARTHVVTPWNADGVMRGLRPDPRTAVVLVTVGRTASQRPADALARVHAAIARTVRPPLRADLTGSSAITTATADAASDATRAGVLIAVPILVLTVLALLVAFRSALALVPAVVGVTTVAASRGVLELLSGVVDVTALAAGLGTIVGAGLGVGYPLLVVARFREEARAGSDVASAVRTTVATTGRAVLLAGAALALAMLVAAQVLPGAVFDAVAVTVAVAALMSAVAAIVVVPALLALLEPLADSWTRPRREPGAERRARRWPARPALAAAATLLPLLAGTAAAFALDTGPPSIRLLSPDDPARVQYEAVADKLGPGWVSPFQIVIDGRDRPVTQPGRLKALAAFERSVARDPGVVTMAGLNRLQRSARELSTLPDRLDDLRQDLAAGKRRLTGVGNRVGDAQVGAGDAASGLADAATAATALSAATGRTHADAAEVAQELRTARPRSKRLVAGLGEASTRGGRLARAADDAKADARVLSAGIKDAGTIPTAIPKQAAALKQMLTAGSNGLGDARARADRAAGQLAGAWGALRRMTTAKGDPRYQAAMQAVMQASILVSGVDPSTGEAADGGEPGIGAGVEDAADQLDLGTYLTDHVADSGRDAQSGIKRLRRGTGRLSDGLGRLASGGDRLVSGLRQLRTGGHKLSSGIGQLSGGADSLVDGLGQAHAGAGRLADGLTQGTSDSQALISGLGKIERGVRRQRTTAFSGASDLAKLRRLAPGLLGSGYLVLAGIDRAGPRTRDNATLLVDVDHGGHVARLLVVPTTGPDSDATQRTRERLTRAADALARRTGSEVVVAGPAAAQRDDDDAVRDRIPALVLLLSALTIVVLVVFVRSLVLSVVAAVLNALIAGATLGVLALVFDQVVTIGAAVVIAMAFGLAIGYELHLLTRVREERVRTGDARQAVGDALRYGGVPLGASAVIMAALFGAFAATSFAGVRGVAVGLAVATCLAALLVCLVGLPAILRLLGDRAWWLPGRGRVPAQS